MIFPDFLIRLENNENGISRLQFVETKGDQLKGNLDTEYKRKVFEYFNELSVKDIDEIGKLKLVKDQEELDFKMIFENEWQTQIRKIID